MLSYVPAGWPTSPKSPPRPFKKSTSAEMDIKTKENVPLTFRMKSFLSKESTQQTQQTQQRTPVKWRLRKRLPTKAPGVGRTIEVTDDVSGKDRLLAILNAEKAKAEEALAEKASNATSSSMELGGESSSTCSTISSELNKSSKNVFRRGVQSIRRSFRKAVKPKMLQLSLNHPELSHDSGLGM